MAQGDGASFRHHSRTRSTRNHDQEGLVAPFLPRFPASSSEDDWSTCPLTCTPLRPSGYDPGFPWHGWGSIPHRGTEIPQTTRYSQNNKIRQNNTEDHVRSVACRPCHWQRPECSGLLPAQPRGRAPHSLHTRQTAGGAGQRRDPAAPVRKAGRALLLESAGLAVVCSGTGGGDLLEGVAAESHVGAGHTGPHGPWSTLVQPFPPLQAKPTHVSGGRGPPVTGGGWASSVEAELTALTQPSSRLPSCSWA